MVAVPLLGLGLALPAHAGAKPKKPAPAAAGKKGAGPAAVKVKAAEPIPGSEPAAQAAAGTPQRGPTRIDFDDRLIQGQTNKSGAVYLYDRKELRVRSMVKKRESFRDEIIASVYDQ